MVYEFMMLLIILIVIIIVLICDVLLPKIKLKYRLHKELKEKKKRQDEFGKKMKELEIK